MYYYNEKAKIIINLDSILSVSYSKKVIYFHMKSPVNDYSSIFFNGDEAEFQKICKMLLDMNTKV